MKLNTKMTRHILRGPQYPAKGFISQGEREVSEERDSTGEGLPGKDTDRRLSKMYQIGDA
jgi:hypothetical protein